MKIKALLLVLIISVLVTFFAGPALAVESGVFKETLKGKVKDRMEEAAKKVLGRGAIIGATLTAKNATTLTLTKDGKTFTVNIDTKTILRRRFWGKATLDEMQVGDILNVHGKWTDDTKTVIDAWLVRDTSIEMRFGAFVGRVMSVSSTGWVMETLKRGTQAVTVSAQTKFVNRKGESITQAEIKAGDRVRVKGLWNRKLNTITEVSHVKDYSIPVKPTPSATP
jgi:hypothetical protein